MWITEFCEKTHKKIHNNHSTWSKAQNQTEDFWNHRKRAAAAENSGKYTVESACVKSRLNGEQWRDLPFGKNGLKLSFTDLVLKSRNVQIC